MHLTIGYELAQGVLPRTCPLAWRYRDTGSCLTAAPGDPAEILSRELMP